MDTSRTGVPGLTLAASHEETVDLLKQVLENLPFPERLDEHPWARSRMVRRECDESPSLKTRRPGVQLAVTVARLFRRMRPPAPPRQGKRLDTRWGEFGLLAARYFAPFMFGLPYPTSLREAWSGIDEAILLLAFDGTQTPDDPHTDPYRLTAGESGAAPESTLSDWQRNGIRRLAEAIESREKYLRDLPALHLQAGARASDRPHRLRAALLSALGVALVLLLALGGMKARRLYVLADSIQAESEPLRELARAFSFESLRDAGPHLSALRRDLESLQREAAPLLWLGPLLDWFPVYGGDLASASDLLDMSVHLSASVDEAHRAAAPVLDLLGSTARPLDLPALTGSLRRARPGLEESRRLLELAVAAQARIDERRLSPRLQELSRSFSGLAPLFDDSLSAALSLPRLLGASAEGPKTYLILLQNEDELRPTGGFITAVGTLVLRDGVIVSLDFERSDALDDWTKAYPPAPWQLQRYMDIPVLVLRDANWYTDFPTAVLNAEYLYSLGRAHSVDGVFALDQRALAMLLSVTGPVDLEDAAAPITEQNLFEYMRSAKLPPDGEPIPLHWDTKAFIGPLARAVLEKVLSGGGVDQAALSRALIQALDERHILLQFDDAGMTGLIARRGWDGAVRPGQGDFLMVADANVGYTKTNAVLETRLVYDVDLTDPLAPEGALTVLQKNKSPADAACAPGQAVSGTLQERTYSIERCYLGYLRVYKSAGTTLTGGTPHPVPAGAMLTGQAVPAAVDTLDEEIEGVQSFGTLVLVPGGQSVSTGLRFALPPGVLYPGAGPGELVYRLKLQKQAGTPALPVLLRVHLPPRARVLSAPEGMEMQGANLLLDTALVRDLYAEIIFALP